MKHQDEQIPSPTNLEVGLLTLSILKETYDKKLWKWVKYPDLDQYETQSPYPPKSQVAHRIKTSKKSWTTWISSKDGRETCVSITLHKNA